MTDDTLFNLPGDPLERPISNSNCIQMFMHCKECVGEVVSGEAGTNSPRDYARLAVGWTPLGIQVWCNRHEANIVHIDFEGCQHPANTTMGGSVQ